MPTYTYECKECNHVFDTKHGMTQSPLKDCPKCNKNDVLIKIITAPTGFSLKGDGWYVTDFKHK